MASVIGSFASQDNAKEAVENLRRVGFSREISVVAKDDRTRKEVEGDADSVADGATSGGILGGLAGLAIGAGAMAVPGLGPLIAAGPIAATLSGAATGGLAGGLIDWGIPEQEGREYEEDVRRGKTLVSVRSDDARVNQAAAILRSHGGENVRVH